MGKSHFVLIHGASYGAWCWYKVATMLKSIGHNVTTIDMGACGLNTKQVQDICSILDYNEPLMTFMESLPSHEKVILVGHSFGGISISMAMEKFPNKISIAIFAAAFVISENLTYPTITQEDLTLALSLVRPFPLFKDDETFNKETTMSMENNGSVPKVYIISNGDNLLTSDSQMWMVERSGPFVEVKVIMDSDHMVMFSKPNQLTSLLLEIANKY
ncbi:methyl jasmonate esterase 1-like isoform X2 [Cicer arietinum]|uniref:Methylesterase 8-like isoform X2 n=1 Tax=Cicer arietinum TaxID=3827 RepID=A0A1S2Z341_CICAR|nr:methylesterase 8-like isoform X2 [Cicer arietinum]